MASRRTPKRDPRQTISRVALAAVALSPLIFSGGADPFRLPKEILIRAATIVIAAAFGIALLFGQTRITREQLRRPEVLLPLAIMGWTGICALMATNRALAAFGLLYVWSMAVLWLALQSSVRTLRLETALLIVLAPALINALLAILQRLRIWNPFHFAPDTTPNLMNTGLLGNPDYVGAYLVAPALVAAAAAIASSQRRWLFAGIAVLLSGGTLIVHSITAVAALMVGLIALAWMLHWQRALIGTLAVIVAVILATAVYKPLHARFDLALDHFSEGDYDALLSGRLGAFAAAWEMVVDHPVTGVGPHCYRYQFFNYRLLASDRYPEAMRFAEKGANFGETHNDHLQVLAETGLPGYALMLTAMVLIAARSFRRTADPSPQHRFATLLALPLILSLATLALAQFPLALPAVLALYLFLSALVVRWTEEPA